MKTKAGASVDSVADGLRSDSRSGRNHRFAIVVTAVVAVAGMFSACAPMDPPPSTTTTTPETTTTVPGTTTTVPETTTTVPESTTTTTVPDEGLADPGMFDLFVSLSDDGFDVSWDRTTDGEIDGYVVQIRQEKPTSTGWMDLTIVRAGDPSVTAFHDGVEGTTYQFRIRERAAAGGGTPPWSEEVSGIFIRPVLPVIRIDTVDRAAVLTKEPKISMTLSLDPNGNDVDAVEMATGTIKGRGNSTLQKPKKPYQIKFDSKQSFLGMPKAKKWILLANWLDPSHLRTFTAGEISRRTDLEWTPQYRWAEVILNGRYVGLYQVTEKVEVDKNRIAIDEMDPDDNDGEALTGGYLLQVEGRLEEKGKPGWRISSALAIAIQSPKEPTPEQYDYIYDYVTAFDTAIKGSNFKDPETGYRKYLDVESFIDWWLVEEAVHNSDMLWDNAYFYKKRGEEKLHFGGVWDFDLSMGNPSTSNDTGTTEWNSVRKRWPTRLFKDPWFVQKINARWTELLPSISEVPQAIRDFAPTIQDAKDNDFMTWPPKNGKRRKEDGTEYLATWLEDRIAWMTQDLASRAGV